MVREAERWDRNRSKQEILDFLVTMVVFEIEAKMVKKLAIVEPVAFAVLSQGNIGM